MKKKRCCRCRRWRSTKDFFNNRSRKDGLDNHCRVCRTSLNVAWRAKRIAENPEYREAVLEAARKYGRTYYQQHKKQCIKNSRKWWKENGKRKGKGYSARYRRSAKGQAARKIGQRRRQLRLRYDLSLESYEQLVKKQKGKCAICHEPPGVQALHVDHDHKTGEVRGLLCSWCNPGLGSFRDNPSLLRAAAKYLQHAQT